MRRIAIAIALCSALPLFAQLWAEYHIVQTYALGGDGGWDYIVPEPAQHRVFVARTNRVVLIDEDNGKLLGEVTGINGAHGTAIAEASGHGFATSGNDQSVIMFDARTFQELARILAADDTDAIIYDPASNRVFTFNGDAHSSTVIDPVAGKRITSSGDTLRLAQYGTGSDNAPCIYCGGNFRCTCNPAAGTRQGRGGRPAVVPGSFKLLVIGRLALEETAELRSAAPRYFEQIDTNVA